MSMKILRVLKRGPKRGLTAADIAERADVNLNTTRFTINELRKAGAVSVVGTKRAPIGRPAQLYTLA